MKKNISFASDHIPINVIKKDYFLEIIGYKNNVQTDNIAHIIQTIYFYHDLIIQARLEKELVSNLCRIFIILSYSAIEALVVVAGHKLQAACYHCDKNPNDARCTIIKDELHAFQLADKFLTKHKILNFSTAASKFYKEFRETRNEVHIIKSRHVISRHPRFNVDYCKLSVQFLQEFVKMLKDNTQEFLRLNRCRTNL